MVKSEGATETEDPLILETRWLMSLKPVDRFNYVNKMINSLADTIKQITQQINDVEGIAQLTVANELIQNFIDDLNEKSTTMIPPIEYAIKQEFRPAFHRFIEDLQKMVNKTDDNVPTQKEDT